LVLEFLSMSQQHTMSERRVLISACALGIVGALTIFIAPGFLGLVADQGRLGEAGAGYVISVDINTAAVAIAIATFLITRIKWPQLTYLAAGLIAIGSFATAQAHTESALIAARVCAGSGEGLAIGVSFAALGQDRNPDRAFGVYLAVGLTVAAAILLVIPVLQPHIGTRPFFIAAGAAAVGVGALASWLPTGSRAASPTVSGLSAIHWRLAIAGLLGVFLYFLAQGAVWSYFGEIGAASHVAPALIGRALAISSIAGIGGALLAVVVCTRSNRGLPLVASAAVSVASFVLLLGHISGIAFVVSGILFNAAWNFSMPFLSGMCSAADARGRIVCSMGCIQTVGTGLGPAVAATLLGRNGFSSILWMSVAVVVLSMAVVLAGLRAHHREAISGAFRSA
jgi:predicted MFS family arabinose efflux permease